MNYGQLKAHVLKLLDEYSSRGSVQGVVKTADIAFKIQDFANDALTELAKITKHPGEFNVVLVDEYSQLTYDLPSDWIDINYAEFVKDERNTENFPSAYYRISPTKKLSIIKNLHPIDITFYYIKKPTLLTFIGDEVTDNAQAIDLGEEAAKIAPYYVAGQVLVSEGELTKGFSYLNQYENKKTTLTGSDGNFTKQITNVYDIGW